MRGSPWSRNHSRFTVDDSDFWSFSFHEWGHYDLPAIVDHIRNESSFQQVLLIGHSQVCYFLDEEFVPYYGVGSLGICKLTKMFLFVRLLLF